MMKMIGRTNLIAGRAGEEVRKSGGKGQGECDCRDGKGGE